MDAIMRRNKLCNGSRRIRRTFVATYDEVALMDALARARGTSRGRMLREVVAEMARSSEWKDRIEMKQ